MLPPSKRWDKEPVLEGLSMADQYRIRMFLIRKFRLSSTGRGYMLRIKGAIPSGVYEVELGDPPKATKVLVGPVDGEFTPVTSNEQHK